MQENKEKKYKKFKKELLVKQEEEIKTHRVRQPQFTTMHVIEGQAGQVNYASLIFYSLTFNNILNIIVMLILVAVTISMAVNGGLFDYAGKAVGETNNAIINESEGYDKYVQDMLIKYGVEEGPVTNPYEADEWEYAWTCTDGVWSEMLTKGQLAEGDIVAKFYKTGKKITPQGEIAGLELTEGDEYHIIIEGQGEVECLVDMDEKYCAWLEQISAYMEGVSTEVPILFYVTELVVCDGVVNIPDYCSYMAMSLNKVTIGNGVTDIGDMAFGACINLTKLVIPDSVKTIGMQAFNYTGLTDIVIGNGVTTIGELAFATCLNLEKITIPSNVTNIGIMAFRECYSLNEIKFLTTDVEKITIGDGIFEEASGNIMLPEGSKIYVLSEEMKTKLAGLYDSTKTTVQVVSLEEMNSI